MIKQTRTILLATALAVSGASYALAQSSPAPANQSGPAVSPTTPSPTDPGVGGASSNVKGTPSTGAMQPPATTGAAPAQSPDRAMQKPSTEPKNVSPSSPQEGIKSQK